MVLIPVMAISLVVSQLSGLALLVVNALVVYFVVGLKSLAEHGRNVAVPLLAGDLSAARQQFAMMVSRDTDKLTEQQVASQPVSRYWRMAVMQFLPHYSGFVYSVPPAPFSIAGPIRWMLCGAIRLIDIADLVGPQHELMMF